MLINFYSGTAGVSDTYIQSQQSFVLSFEEPTALGEHVIVPIVLLDHRDSSEARSVFPQYIYCRTQARRKNMCLNNLHRTQERDRIDKQ